MVWFGLLLSCGVELVSGFVVLDMVFGLLLGVVIVLLLI